MKHLHTMYARALSCALALLLLLGTLPVSAMAADGERDTNFFKPVKHMDVDYDKIVYQHVDIEPLLKEIARLRELSADAANLETFRARFLALADQLDYQTAMVYYLGNLQYADSKDTWAAAEYEKIITESTTAADAFSSLVRDALSSPCASAFDDLLSGQMRKYFLEYKDKPAEEIELRAQETALQSEYMSKIVDEYAVTIDGVKYTENAIAQAYAAGEMTYEEYWPIHVEIVKATNAVVGPIFVEMIGVRNRIAELAGYDSYAAYAYKELYHRDYTVEDAQAFCELVKRYIVPKTTAYGLLYQTPDQNEMLKGVAYSGEGMFETLLPYFAQLSDELAESARFTYEHKAYDVDPGPNKTGTAYSCLLTYFNMPFYFANASGDWNDLTTAIHELGHNNNAYWNPQNWNDPLLVYDTAEVHSQGLELLMQHFYPEIFGSQADKVATAINYNILDSITQGCLYDEFQRRVYEMPDVTLEKVNQTFRQVAAEYERVSADDPRTELYSWYGVPHNFLDPMYFISYATSAAGAFEFWVQSQDDFFAAVDDYLRFASHGFEMGFAETFAAIGKESPMTESYLKSVAQTMHDKLLLVKPYTDVYADDWYGKGVVFVDYYALMQGVGDNLFAPEAAATREQSMTILARAGDDREDTSTPYTVDEGVAWAMEKGISDGENRKDTLTREQFVTMLYRFAKEAGYEMEYTVDMDTILSYADGLDLSEWAVPAMLWACQNGIISGMDDNMLAPQSAVTRAQIAVMFLRFYTNVE